MNRTAAQDNAQIETGAMQLPDNEERFAIEGAAVIDGDRAAMPA